MFSWFIFYLLDFPLFKDLDKKIEALAKLEEELEEQTPLEVGLKYFLNTYVKILLKASSKLVFFKALTVFIF